MSDIPGQIILMRSDMASLNAGKGMAQAAHASSVMAARFENASRGDDPIVISHLLPVYEEWQQTTVQQFGTCLVLDGIDEDTIRETMDAVSLTSLYGEIIHDPTYPVLDGTVCHHIPINTCAVIFGMKSETDSIPALQRLRLHV